MSSLLSVQQLSKSFGVRTLFSEIAFSVGMGERVALIGSNGSGKSTLLKILMELEQPDQGEVVRRSGAHLAYVPQQDLFPAGSTVESVLEAGAINLLSDHRAAINRAFGAAAFSDLQQQVDTLSGGQKKRLAVMAALIQEPDLLLLDEPTNHLDIESIIWLQETLDNARCAVLFISHDRYFIEDLATRVIELDPRYPKGLLSVEGTYDVFLQTRLEFFEQLKSYQSSLANKVRREIEWLRQGAKARTTKQSARIKRANQMISELGEIKLDSRKAAVEFSESGRRSKEFLKVEEGAFSHADRAIFKDLNILLSPGTRLGLVGSNGSGKSTILKVLQGELKLSSGKIWSAPNLRVAYFDQQREQLDLTQTLHRALCPDGDSVVVNGQAIHVVAWAQRFLFHPTQLRSLVGQLSGGERARLLLARLMKEPADLLLLDEPTNDLDIPTLEVLQEAFIEFAGALVLVTHDRYMLDAVCTKVVGVMGDTANTPGELGYFADYSQLQAELDRRRKARNDRSNQKDSGGNKGAAAESSAGEGSKGSPQNGAANKLSFKERKELGTIEGQIAKAEQKLADLQAGLSNPVIASDAYKLTELCEQIATAQAGVDQLYQRWHELEQRQG